MRTTLIGARLPSHATLLSARPIGAMLSQINREPINLNADDEYYNALKICQDKSLRTVILTYSFSFPLRSTLAVKYEDGDPWMNSNVEEMNGTDNQGQSYIIRLMKTGRQIMCNVTNIHSK